MRNGRLRAMAIAATVLAATWTAAARAQDLPFGDGAERAVCYMRLYSAEHLNDHPRQRVSAIFAWNDLTDTTLAPGANAETYITVALRTRERAKLYWNQGVCTAGDGDLACGIDCDGGRFRLRARETSLLLENDGFALVGCGDEEAHAWLEPEPDDRLFRLEPAPLEVCQAIGATIDPEPDWLPGN